MLIFRIENMEIKKCHILHTESILCSILLLHHLKQWHVRKGNLLFQLTILKKDSVVNTLFQNWTLLLGQKEKPLSISVKFAISHVNSLHIMATNDLQLPNKHSSYGCKLCSNITLSITLCFEMFHSYVKYREQALTNRINKIISKIYYIFI